MLLTLRAAGMRTCRYARKVSQGYRPARPKRMSDGAWQLIEACWQQDPVLRPHMSEVGLLLCVLAGACMLPAGWTLF